MSTAELSGSDDSASEEGSEETSEEASEETDPEEEGSEGALLPEGEAAQADRERVSRAADKRLKNRSLTERMEVLLFKKRLLQAQVVGL